MNYLGIDYGEKRIGLAWVQEGLDVVLPFGVVKDMDELVKLIKKEKIDKIVIGLPVGLDGKENANTKQVKKFADELKNKINLPVEFEDERFSSRQADSMGGDVSPRQGGASRDEKAAMVILSSYLERNM